MSREHIVAVPHHMVDHSISIQPDSVLSASVDHVPQRLGVALSRVEFVADWLVEPVPGIKLSVLGVLEVKDSLLGRKYLDAHVACFSDHFTLLGDIIIGPAEHLDYCALLSSLKVVWLVDGGVVPYKIDLIQHQCGLHSLPFNSLHLDLQQLTCSTAHEEGVGGGLLIIVVISEWEYRYLRVRVL